MYKTKPDEVIILREEYAYYNAGEIVYPTGELILTTESLAFSEVTYSKTRKDPLRNIVIPIEEIQVYDDKPQVKHISKITDNWIEIYTKGGEIYRFGIGMLRKRAKTVEWVNAIKKVATGRTVTEEKKGLFGKWIEEQDDVRHEPMEAIKTCKHCGAPIRGFSGRYAQCEYCGSGQRL